MAARNSRASADGGLQADLTRMLDGYLSTLPVHRNAARGGAMPTARTADDMTVRLRQLPTAELEKRLAAQRQLHEKIERKIITPPDGGARVVATIAALDVVLAERRGVDDLAYKLASARLDPSATAAVPVDGQERDVVVLDAPTASAASMARSPPKWKMQPAKVAALSAEETLVYAEEMRKANQQRKIQEQIERLRRGTRNMHLQQLHAASSASSSSTLSPRASPGPISPYRPTASTSATTRPVPHNARYQDEDDDDDNESSFDVSDDDLDDGLDLGRDEGGESSAYFSESDDDHGVRF